MRVELPYAPTELSPNSRSHHMAKWRVGKAAQDEAYWATNYVKPRDWEHDGSRLPVTVTFHPVKGKAAADVDNYLAREKKRIDGIALALKVNDRLFDFTPRLGEPVPNGAVVYEIGA